MTHLIDAAWALTKLLSYGGLLAALTGVAVFGWHFVRINAAAAQGDSGDVPAASWRGAGARRGLMWAAAGAGLLLISILLATILPSRP